MLVWQKLSVCSAQSLPPWLPSVEISKSWCGRQGGTVRRPRRALQGVGYAGDVDVVWLYLPVLWKALLWGCEGEKPREQLQLHFRRCWWGKAFPVVAVLICKRYSRPSMCSRDRLYWLSSYSLGSWDKWKELIAKRSCDCLRDPSFGWQCTNEMSFVASKSARLPDRGLW